VENQEIALQLSTDDINLILEALGSLPFVKVYALIGKIQQQASGQLGKDKPSSINPPAPLP
jgi:hypothetical protein